MDFLAKYDLSENDMGLEAHCQRMLDTAVMTCPVAKKTLMMPWCYLWLSSLPVFTTSTTTTYKNLPKKSVWYETTEPTNQSIILLELCCP